MTPTRRRFGFLAAGALSSLASCGRGDAPEQPEAGKEASLLERAYVLDLHCDTPMRIHGEGFDLGGPNDYGQVDIPRMREGGVTGLFFSVYTPAKRGATPQAHEEALSIIDAVEAEIARHPDDLTRAGSTAEIEAAKRDGKMAILFGIEGGHMIDSSLDLLKKLFDLGGRYLTLTHSKHTPWAGSSGDSPEDDPGLTGFGRKVVAEMNRLGMMIDISHVSDKTFAQAIEATRAPAVASHSSCRALGSHARNMTDEMIRRLAENGGVMHINYAASFLDDAHAERARADIEHDEQMKAARRELGDKPRELAAAEWRINMERIERIGRVPFSRLLDHFEHAAKVGGVEHVGMGSDFDGVSEQLPEGMEDVSKIPHLIDGLLGRGFSEADIEKILGGNTMRVMRDVESAAAREV